MKIIPLVAGSLGAMPKQFGNRLKQIGITAVTPLDETQLDTVRELILPRGFSPSTSTSRARLSDAATFDKD